MINHNDAVADPHASFMYRVMRRFENEGLLSAKNSFLIVFGGDYDRQVMDKLGRILAFPFPPTLGFPFPPTLAFSKARRIVLPSASPSPKLKVSARRSVTTHVTGRSVVRIPVARIWVGLRRPRAHRHLLTARQ